ncbi:MAG: hypothetical protein KAI29_06035 [Cyclobacteriaceae bacterium]|nr:hypothetical protein [Cyclobacteriaceae bacterium]
MLYFRYSLFQLSADNWWQPSIISGFQAVDPVIVLIELIIAHLMMHIQHDQDEGGNSNGQAENIYKGSDFVAPEDSECDDEEAA